MKSYGIRQEQHSLSCGRTERDCNEVQEALDTLESFITETPAEEEDQISHL